jgi:adenine-specific DNA-methyltransferase
LFKNNDLKQDDVFEDPAFLNKQIITYLGNKHSLLSFIDQGLKIVQSELNKSKLDIADLFSGSGIVARYFKSVSANLYVNDVEPYAYTLNQCYLTNYSEVDIEALTHWSEYLRSKLTDETMIAGFISKMYAPKDDGNILLDERAFYTSKNAKIIDTLRTYINDVPSSLQKYFLAPLLVEASKHTNTSGNFKGFYKNSETKIGQYGGNGKNALKRILGEIKLELPIFSKYTCKTHVFCSDTNTLISQLPMVDLVYLDPPYNQHPYGSNYFMLNLINDYVEPKEVSKISGIPLNWNRSPYNSTTTAKEKLFDLCLNVKARYILISFNSDGYIKYEEMVNFLNTIGKVRVFEHTYPTYKASRNLANRNTHVKEYLYLVEKSI